MIVRVNHMRLAGICNKGARRFFKDHGISWSDFVRNGVPAETLVAADPENPDVAKVIATASAFHEQGRKHA